jgi:hypothetical protein
MQQQLEQKQEHPKHRHWFQQLQTQAQKQWKKALVLEQVQAQS